MFSSIVGWLYLKDFIWNKLWLQVKLSLEKGFKRSITYNFTDDAHMEDLFMDHAKKYEFADITWYPSRNTSVYRYDNRVPFDTPGDGVYDFLGFQSNSILVSKATRATGIQLSLSLSVTIFYLISASFRFILYKRE